jgi:RNA polymerase sigma-70 factor (ECF subfamily)
VDSVSTRELILQLQSGSLDALGKLYDNHNKMVYRTALAITGDTDVAADLMQDVFLRLHRFAARIEPDRPLEPWLYRVTANLSYSWVKRRRWLCHLEDIAEWFAGEKKRNPHHLAEAEEESRRISKAISILPVQQRIVVVLYYINDLSLQEIADILDVPLGTVKSRLHYGRRLLKKHLDFEGELITEVQYEFT